METESSPEFLLQPETRPISHDELVVEVKGAVVNVNVGSLNDADDMPGMGQAVEELLFAGTKKVGIYTPGWYRSRQSVWKSRNHGSVPRKTHQNENRRLTTCPSIPKSILIGLQHP